MKTFNQFITETSALAAPPDPNEMTRSEVGRHLATLSRVLKKDYTPILDALKNNGPALGLLSDLLKQLGGMTGGSATSALNRAHF